MAAGALVAGCHGDGDLGLPQARHAALWVHTVSDAVTALGSLVQQLRDGDPAADRQCEAAHRLVETCSLRARNAALLRVWRALVGDG